MFRKKKISNRLCAYPSCDLLNNALRILLNNPDEYDHAIKEIKLAIKKAGGYFHDDIAKELKEDD